MKNQTLTLEGMEQTLSVTDAAKQLRNLLAGRTIGITRDKALLSEVIKCLFVFKNGIQEDQRKKLSDEEIARKYREVFKEVREKLKSIFPDEELLLSPYAIARVHEVFKNTNFEQYTSDPLSIFYQEFISNEVRGSEGQFFTPDVAVGFLIDAIQPAIEDKTIDPACGAGSFLARTATRKLELGASLDIINETIYGVEKDEYLASLSKLHLAFLSFNDPNIVTGDSIENIDIEGNRLSELDYEQYDLVLANPPFGAKIKVGSDEAKERLDLAHTWIINKANGKYEKTNKIIANPSPQILFIEICIRLLKEGGTLGIVVPESMLSPSSGSYVVQYMLSNLNIELIVGMPEVLFKTSGKGGTHTKACLVIGKKCKAGTSGSIFMAEAKKCGHDSRGRSIPDNDLPSILENFRRSKFEVIGSSHLGYMVDSKEIKSQVLAPRYYNPEIILKLNFLKDSHDLVSIGDLVKNGLLEIKTGDEVGALSYGTGAIPFIRTSDISNWEIKVDPKHGVSEDIYNYYHTKQDVKEGDLLMVKDGTYLIGTCAYISKFDTKIVYQSHLYKLRCLKPCDLSPFFLLAALSSDVVMTQIQNKRFTQDIIDSLGRRILELIIPVPKNKSTISKIVDLVQNSINDRIESRELAREARRMVTGL